MSHQVCHDIGRWVDENVTEQVEKCVEQDCDWWCACCNKWFCFLVWVVVVVTKWVVDTVCEIVGDIVDVIVALVLLIVNIVIGIVTFDFGRIWDALVDAFSSVVGLGGDIIRLMTLVVAFDLLGLPAVSVVLQQLLLWLPNLVVALVVLVIGGLAAKAFSRLVRGTAAEAGLGNPEVLAAVTRVAVWSFTLLVAVSQLGIATNVIDALVAGVVGALALATGLAFGLGGRDQAARILDRLGERAELAGPRLHRAAAVAVERPSRAGNAEFDESWIPRSGKDRRRVARPGIDRRRAVSA